MTIHSQMQENTWIVSIEGRLDTNTSPELEEFLKSQLEGKKEVVLDFAALDYISSAGLRVLLATQKQMNQQGSLKIRNISETIQEIFEVTGFSDILEIE